MNRIRPPAFPKELDHAGLLLRSRHSSPYFVRHYKVFPLSTRFFVTLTSLVTLRVDLKVTARVRRSPWCVPFTLFCRPPFFTVPALGIVQSSKQRAL